MPRREHTAEVRIASRCFGEENSSVSFMNQFSTENRLQAMSPVPRRESESLHTVHSCR